MIAIDPVSLAEKPVLRNLMELYLHDFTEFDNADIGDNGLYGYEYLDCYWTEEDRYSFLVRVDGRLAGFVLVHKIAGINTIAEFFVMRKYRRRGVGTEVAIRIFDRFRGKWNVTQMSYNVPAQSFWRKVIRKYTGGEYMEREWEMEGNRGLLQEFMSRTQCKENQ
ncbi:MAG: GNAT family N-acetyltransferase [bacterium]